MDLSSICIQQEYCTNCPARIGCLIRELFYSEEKYIRLMQASASIGNMFWAFLGASSEKIHCAENTFQAILSKKRQKELELHPTYSHD